MNTCESKIVVFDLDETLGYFVEFGMLWDSIKSYIDTFNIATEPNQELFNKCLHLFPEFLRPNILDILKYLKRKKQKNHCSKLMVYTNNQGPKSWATFIVKYFEDKLQYKLFDKIISAFKVNGQHVELCRTTHLKTHSDFIRCTMVPENTQICFLDDVYYPDMKHDRIYYINVKPYIYDIELETLIQRLIDSNILDIPNVDECKNYLFAFMNNFHYIYLQKTNESYCIDKIISKKIIQHLEHFFESRPTNKKTKKYKQLLNRTLKKHRNVA